MTVTDAWVANGLAALGNRTRLALFRLLVRAGPDGMTIGAIQQALDAAPSTLAHHIATLVRAGLIEQEKRGREVINRAAYEAMNALIDHLTAECCAGVPVAQAEDAA
ncbi:MAG: metalloregulator ArsR/SmtB family transcription factor [Pseudomonadota bacterium]